MQIAKDITLEISKQVRDEHKKTELLNLCKEVSLMRLNVGHNQLLRCMLLLSAFDPAKFQEILDKKFDGDPRDVILEAHNSFKGINFGIKAF